MGPLSHACGTLPHGTASRARTPYVCCAIDDKAENNGHGGKIAPRHVCVPQEGMGVSTLDNKDDGKYILRGSSECVGCRLVILTDTSAALGRAHAQTMHRGEQSAELRRRGRTSADTSSYVRCYSGGTKRGSRGFLRGCSTPDAPCTCRRQVSLHTGSRSYLKLP